MRDDPFNVAGRFLEAHGDCPDVVIHQFRLPRDGSVH